ncbi:alpha/beta hydrolase family protein, partial [Vibrio parahaemolyticus]
LILHGDEDNNTFISNSKELYQALRQRGVPTQFVHYPREGHGLLEPNHRLDEMRRCLAWMDRYVRHAGDPPGLFRPGDRILVENGL